MPMLQMERLYKWLHDNARPGDKIPGVIYMRDALRPCTRGLWIIKDVFTLSRYLEGHLKEEK